MEFQNLNFLLIFTLLISVTDSNQNFINTLLDIPDTTETPADLSTETKILIDKIFQKANTGKLTKHMNNIGLPKLLDVLKELNEDEAFELEGFILQILAREAEDEVLLSQQTEDSARNKRDSEQEVTHDIPPSVYEGLPKSCQDALNEIISSAKSHDLTRYIHSHYSVITQLYTHMNPLFAHKLNDFIMSQMHEENNPQHDNGHHHSSDHDGKHHRND